MFLGATNMRNYLSRSNIATAYFLRKKSSYPQR